MKAPISRVLPTPVASAKHSEGKSRSKSESLGNYAFKASTIAANSCSERARWSRSAGTDSSV